MSTSASKAVRELSWFLTAAQQGVVRRFQSVPGSITLPGPKGQGPIVFIPGTKATRALLVAHYDTVWDTSFTQNPVKVRFSNGLFFSTQPKLGIGADDRAGCTMLWLLRELGHSLLLVPGEEKGCLGTHHLIKEHPSLLTGHQMALEFDRRDARDIATYSCQNPDHIDYLLRFFPDYIKTWGSSTDIRHLGPHMGVASANFSIGFRNEHSAAEVLRLGDFLHTYWGAADLLSQTELPLFPHKETPTYTTPAWSYPSKSSNPPSAAAKVYSPSTKTPSPVDTNEVARVCRVAGQQPVQPKTGTIILLPSAKPLCTYFLGASDERIPVTRETGEGYCESCHTFLSPSICVPDAANILTCPCCQEPVRSFFS